MKTADIVNTILDRLRTSRVVFDLIELHMVRFSFGGMVYQVTSIEKNLSVIRIDSKGTYVDNYSKWVEGVLNGMVRNDAGDLVPRDA